MESLLTQGTSRQAVEAGCWLAVESHEEARMREKRNEGTQGTPWSLRKTKEQKLVN